MPTKPKQKIPFTRSRRIEVSVMKTVNLGNYESLKVQAGYAENIKERENPEAKYNDAWNLVNYQIMNAIEEHLEEGTSDVTRETGSRVRAEGSTISRRRRS